MRNHGSAIGYACIGYGSLLKGLNKIDVIYIILGKLTKNWWGSRKSLGNNGRTYLNANEKIWNGKPLWIIKIKDKRLKSTLKI